MTTYATKYIAETIVALQGVDTEQIERCVGMLANLRAARGRLFVLGNGGSAANASHAVNDFRKLCGIEAYAPTDNVAELTAWANDFGWSHTFDTWLTVSRLGQRDMLLVLSVGGGTAEASPNLIKAIDLAVTMNAKVLAIAGSSTGHAATHATECIVVPEVHPARVTAHAEECQAIIWHLMANHPALRLA